MEVIKFISGRSTTHLKPLMLYKNGIHRSPGPWNVAKFNCHYCQGKLAGKLQIHLVCQ